jgi:hypothetical protein
MTLSRFAQLVRVAQHPAKGKASPAKRKTTKGTSKLEIKLRQQIELAGLQDGMEAEYCAIPGRKLRWDFAWPRRGRILVEIQGGIWAKGGHTSGVGVNRDTEKANIATLAGWHILSVTSNQINSGQALRWLQDALRKFA